MDIEEAQRCPQCDKRSVTFDFIQGILVCQDCGRVLHDSELVPQLSFFGSEHRPTGVFVEARDTGLGASGKISQGTKAVKQSRQRDSLAKATKLTQEVASKLGLPPPIVEQATHFMEQIRASLGSWHHDHLVGAAMYTAIRMNKLPLTLLDLAGVLQRDMYTLGRRYHDALRLLEVRPPQVQPQDLLERTLHRTLDMLGAGSKLSQDSISAILKDGRVLLDWMEVHLLTRRHPIVNVGAAIALSSDMNQLPLSVDAIASTLHVWRPSLDQKISQIKHHLLSLAKLLPYGDRITMKNVASHARLIMRMSDMLATSADRPQLEQQQQQQQQPEAIVAGPSANAPAVEVAAAAPSGSLPFRQVPASNAASIPAVAIQEEAQNDASGSQLGNKRGAGKKRGASQKSQPARDDQQQQAKGKRPRRGGKEVKPASPPPEVSAEEQQLDTDEEDEQGRSLTDVDVDEYVRSEEEIHYYRQLFDLRTIETD